MFFTRELNTQKIFENMVGLSCLPLYISGSGAAAGISVTDHVGTGSGSFSSELGYTGIKNSVGLDQAGVYWVFLNPKDLSNFSSMVCTYRPTKSCLLMRAVFGVCRDRVIPGMNQSLFVSHGEDTSVCRESSPSIGSFGVGSSTLNLEGLEGSFYPYIEIYAVGDGAGQYSSYDLINMILLV